MAYTYEDFEKAANKAGLLGQFGQADLSTARNNPDFGMSLLTLKQNYANAGTDEERQSIHTQADELRSSYGNYTGGADGSQFVSTGKLPNDIDDKLTQINSYAPFSYDAEKPAYTSQNDGKISGVLDQIGSYGPFSYDAVKPTYTNQYSSQQAALLDEILNRKEFEWSKEADPQWSAYKKEYLREGERAQANALAQASAASGGRPSSYALTAAGQAGDYYAAQLSDMIPTLYQQAYDRYVSEHNMKLNDLSAVNSQEQIDYGKYLDELGQYNADRNFAYGEYQDRYNMLQSYLENLRGAEQTEYNRYLNELNQYNTDRDFAYGQYQDQYNMLRGQLADLQGQQQTEFDQNRITREYQDEMERYRQEQQQAQINAILDAGGTPGEQLLSGSGYTDEYVRAIAEEYQRQQAEEKARMAAELMAQAGQYGRYAELAGLSGEETALLNAYAQQASEKGRAGSSGTGRTGSGGSSGSSGSKMTLTTAKQAASAGVFSDEVLAVLYDNGYSDEMLKAIYGYDPAAGGYNESYFNSMAQSMAVSLEQGRADSVVSGLDGVWDKLSRAQKQTIRELLARYGYQYEEG